jgi:hypothetical protein
MIRRSRLAEERDVDIDSATWLQNVVYRDALALSCGVPRRTLYRPSRI